MQKVSEDANMVSDSPTLWLYFFPSGIFMAACWPVCMRIKSMKRARVGQDTLIIVVFGVLAKGRGITERVTQRRLTGQSRSGNTVIKMKECESQK